MLSNYKMLDEEAAMIASSFVSFHEAHSTALKSCSLTYIDKLLDSLMLQRKGLTAREMAWELQRMVPDLSTDTAHALIGTKFLGVDFDSKVN